MTTDITILEYVPMSNEEKAIFFRKLASLNAITAKYMQQIKDGISYNFSMETFRTQFLGADPNSNFTCINVIIPKEDLVKMQSVKNYEHRALQSIANLITSLAYKASQIKSTQLEFEDYYNEAVMAAINAVYSYTDPNIQFTTFVQTSIRNKIMNINNANRFTSPVNQHTRKHFKIYNEKKAKNPSLSFEEIVKEMNLNKREIVSLKSMFTSFTAASQFSDDDNQNDKLLTEKIDDRKNTLLEEYDRILSETEMTDWERKVLDAFLHGKDHGWATEVAESNINPETGLPYSRRAPRLALDRVIERIRLKYFSDFKEGDSIPEAA